MFLLFISGCGSGSDTEAQTNNSNSHDEDISSPSLLHESETLHLTDIKQLTFGGENAEAYFSHDGSRLIFQSTRDSFECDQIFSMNSDGSNVELISTGKGRTTCSFISPDDKRIVYASTHLTDPSCPPPPDMSQGYVWALCPQFDIFSCDPDGSNIRRLTDNPLYDAEAVYSPDGKKIVFTSLRDGDLDIYTMNPDGSDVNRITSELGYDGGPFFSFDSEWICYRAAHPKTEDEKAMYLKLLAHNEIKPSQLQIFISRVDGSERRQVTELDGANFCPYFHPDGKRLIFTSNHHSGTRNFDLFMINVDGTGLKQITFDEDFDGFPMFSHDGKKLVFASNRNSKVPGETNIFIAEWKD
jgi:TolB protein